MMAAYIREVAKQAIDELSEGEIMELLEFLSYLRWKHEKTGQESHREICESLNELLKECSVDNWDGYGAKALQSGSYREALRFIQSLPTTIPAPEVAVDPDGEVAFEWDNGSRRVFSISVSNSGELIYAGIFGSNKTHGTEVFEDGLPKIILDNLQRVLL